LTVGAQQALNLSLKVGQLSQTVEVNAAPPDIQTTSSTISATVDSITVRQLPLNGRDWTSLATLEPGVVSIPNQATTSFSANKGNRGFGNQLSSRAARPPPPPPGTRPSSEFLTRPPPHSAPTRAIADSETSSATAATAPT